VIVSDHEELLAGYTNHKSERGREVGASVIEERQ